MSETLAEDAALDGGEIEETPTDVTAGADADAAALGAAEATDEAEAPTETPEGFTFADEYEAEAWARSRFDDYLHDLAANAPQPQAERPDYVHALAEADPFDENYGQLQVLAFEQMLDRREANWRQEQEQAQHAAYVDNAITSTIDETAARLKIADDDKNLLSFLADQEADRLMASGYRGEEGGRLAVNRAAEQLIARDKRIREEAVKAYRESVGGVADQRGEPGVGGAAINAVSPAESYEDATRRVFEKHGIPYT